MKQRNAVPILSCFSHNAPFQRNTWCTILLQTKPSKYCHSLQSQIQSAACNEGMMHLAIQYKLYIYINYLGCRHLMLPLRFRPHLSSHIRPGQHQKCTKRKRCLGTECQDWFVILNQFCKNYDCRWKVYKVLMLAINHVWIEKQNR